MEHDDKATRWCFEQFVREFCLLPRDEFVRAFPMPLLVQHSEPGGGERVLDATPTFGTISINIGRPKPPRPVWVYAVAKKANPFVGMITVGRAPNNDVVLPYDEISKFHAFFLETSTGWLLADAQSTNGTSLRGVRLQPNKPCALSAGGAAIAHNGVGVAFAGVQAVLHAPGKLWDHVASTKAFVKVA